MGLDVARRDRWLVGLPNILYLRIVEGKLTLRVLLATIFKDLRYVVTVMGRVLREVAPPVGEYQDPCLSPHSNS
jgi:hypothetical protein